ncbi:hypothetical protein AB0395_23110 [Streptosporangium sp. NPDC051023]|uniref:hypothetical protein n=1 Tax=Streptosporangium sp. NPDC051023 TaxID=3155410 RepID=UPI00344C6CB7
MDYAPRYRTVAERAGLVFEPGDPVVVERAKGGTTTDFGAIEAIPALDGEPVGAAEAERAVALVRAAWGLFDLAGRSEGAFAGRRACPRRGVSERGFALTPVSGF